MTSTQLRLAIAAWAGVLIVVAAIIIELLTIVHSQLSCFVAGTGMGITATAAWIRRTAP